MDLNYVWLLRLDVCVRFTAHCTDSKCVLLQYTGCVSQSHVTGSVLQQSDHTNSKYTHTHPYLFTTSECTHTALLIYYQWVHTHRLTYVFPVSTHRLTYVLSVSTHTPPYVCTSSEYTHTHTHTHTHSLTYLFACSSSCPVNRFKTDVIKSHLVKRSQRNQGARTNKRLFGINVWPWCTHPRVLWGRRRGEINWVWMGWVCNPKDGQSDTGRPVLYYEEPTTLSEKTKRRFHLKCLLHHCYSNSRAVKCGTCAVSRSTRKIKSVFSLILATIETNGWLMLTLLCGNTHTHTHTHTLTKESACLW